jgi:hypothetical protein
MQLKGGIIFMIYKLIRFAIILILLIAGLFAARKYKRLKDRKRASIIFFVILTLCIFISFPIERQFVRFNSPQKAFEYSFGSVNLIKIIQGDDVAVALYNNTNSPTCSYVKLEKDKKGWLMYSNNSGQIELKSFNTYTVAVAKSSHSGEKIIIINSFYSDLNNKELQIADNYHSKFKENDLYLFGNKRRLFYSVISEFEKDCVININGKSIKIN